MRSQSGSGVSDRGAAARAPFERARAEAFRAVGELEAAIGLALAALPDESRFRPWLTRIRADLVDLGSDLALPFEGERRPPLRIEARQVQWLEATCEQARREVVPLRAFMLPGWSEAAACLRAAHGVCRRAERRVAGLARLEPAGSHRAAYLRRLGDLLFVFARAVDADTGARPRLRRPSAATLARAAERIAPEPAPPRQAPA